MSFHIHEQHAEHINNVIGDQYNIRGNQHNINAAEARQLVRQLRDAVDQNGLPPDVASVTRVQLDEAERELGRVEPRKPAIADRLARLTQLLASVGALASAGTALGAPLTLLAGWLGSLGDPIRHHLRG